MALRTQFEKYRLFLTAWIAGHLLFSAMQGVGHFIIEPGREETLPSVLHGLMHVGFGVVPAIPVLLLYHRVRGREEPRVSVGHHVATSGLIVGSLLNVWGVWVLFAGGVMQAGSNTLSRPDYSFDASGVATYFNLAFQGIVLGACVAVTIFLGHLTAVAYGGPAAVLALGVIGLAAEEIGRRLKPDPVG